MAEGPPKPPGTVDDPHDPVKSKKETRLWTTSFDRGEKAKEKVEEEKTPPEVAGETAAEPKPKPAEDREAWREHFGSLAEVQEETEKKDKDLKEWKEHFGEGLTGQVESSVVEATKPTAETADKILAELTPEQVKTLEDFKSAAEKQTTAIETRAGSKGFLERIKQVGEFYNRQPLWKKLALGGGLMLLGIPGSSIPQKILSGVGMFATIDALTKDRIANKYFRGAVAGAGAVAYGLLASQLFNFVDSKLGISDAIRGWFTHAPVAPGVVPDFNIFSGEAIAGHGDTVWSLAEEKLKGMSDFVSLDRGQQDFVIDSYLKHMQSLGTGAVQSMGIHSGDINLIQAGEHINLSSLNDQTLFNKFLDGAKKLTADQLKNIISSRN